MSNNHEIRCFPGGDDRVSVHGWDDGSVWLVLEHCHCGRHASDQVRVLTEGATTIICPHCQRGYTLQLHLQKAGAKQP